MKKTIVEKWLLNPIEEFIHNSVASGVILFLAALAAMIVSNSLFAHAFHEFWEIHFKIGFGNFVIDKNLHHWINDGLMSMFFFVVGLELKREIVAGELKNPKNAILPIVAAIGGMIVPAAVYYLFNHVGGSENMNGWGIPMATDIAFALGVIYLLGNRVPLSLKIFLTVLAIIDDLGAVLVIAFFYTSDVSFISLLVGAGFFGVMVIANLIGVRSALFFGIMGIGGLWTAFLMSGIHATIAAVIAAFTIPARVKISEEKYIDKMKTLLKRFSDAPANNVATITSRQQDILDDIRDVTNAALTPLQKLEKAMHPLVAFVIMPVFALANAGVSLGDDFAQNLGSSVTWGVGFGLLLGKVIGVFGVVLLLVKMKWVSLPKNVRLIHMFGVSFLTAIGFTMSLFITSLAFKDNTLILQAKIGVLLASLIAGTIGYAILYFSGGEELDKRDE